MKYVHEWRADVDPTTHAKYEMARLNAVQTNMPRTAPGRNAIREMISAIKDALTGNASGAGDRLGELEKSLDKFAESARINEVFTQEAEKRTADYHGRKIAQHGQMMALFRTEKGLRHG